MYYFSLSLPVHVMDVEDVSEYRRGYKVYHPVNTPHRYTTGRSLGLSKGLNTNHMQQGTNQFANDVWKSR